MTLLVPAESVNTRDVTSNVAVHNCNVVNQRFNYFDAICYSGCKVDAL